ncbi:sensor histidine kinase [Paracoccus nototheniae]|uniref:sensor histidine kinase n=1 Tax=Paracoccus nototheniae TaxID=2489002 RepID=UPI001F61EE2A|nr:sensor histidine kinase [Paracoccus nototheniae]
MAPTLLSAATGSLRRRLLAWLLAATAVLGLAAMADTWAEAVGTARAVSDRVLAGSALAIAERVTVADDAQLQVDIPYSALEMLTSTAQDSVFYRVDGPGGFMTGYDRLPVADPGAAGQGYADAVFADAPIRVITLARTVSTGVESIPFRVTVAESRLARNELAQAILVRSALRLALMICGASAIIWIAVPLALRPLNRLGEAISARRADDLSPLPTDVPLEVQGLVAAMNSFMARLDTALVALRNFTGNASHQLRTPLAVIRTQLALAQRAGDPALAHQAVAKGDAALADAERILAQLLLLARVDAAADQPLARPLDATALARDLTGEMIPHAAGAGIDLGFEAEAGDTPAVMVRAEPVLLAEALKNLIDNALAYAGRGAVVTVRVARTGDDVDIWVEDDGPGIAPEVMNRLAQRFVRGAAGPARPGGSGLGLAIVTEIAQLFGGRMVLDHGAGGRGLKAGLHLPTA